MKAIDLYRFITAEGIESKFHENNGKEDVLLFPSIYQIEDFNKLLPSSIYDEDVVECTMKDGYFAIWMNDICEYCGIEIKDVFGVSSIS